MSADMWALGYDREADDWDTTRGLRKVRVPKPVIDSTSDEDNDQVIVKVLYTGFCGSDRGIWFRNSFQSMIVDSLKKENKTFRTVGHEMLGEVVEFGVAVKEASRIHPGDIVAAESHITCGECLQCRLGERHVCQNERIIGFTRDGCFAEYIKLPADVLWPTNPEKIRMEVAAIQEPYGNAVHACTRVDLKGKSVAVFGCGTIGLFTIMTARALGATKIIGIEPNEENAAMAEKIGVDELVRFTPDKSDWRSSAEVVERVMELSGGGGVDVAIEMAGYNSSVNNAIRSVRMGGDVVLFGIKSGDFTIEDFSSVVVRGITLHSVIGREIWRTWEKATALLEAHENGIQQNIYDVILQKGQGTTVKIDDYDIDSFEKQITAHPKMLIKW